MKNLLHLFTPLILLAAVFLFERPAHLRGQATILDEPLVLVTSLQDSLPSHALTQLAISHRILGTKIKYANGLYASYFEYKVDSKTLIRTLGSLPFSRTAIIADTLAHPVTRAEFDQLRQKVSTAEQENLASFWNLSSSDAVVYECMKPPFRHTVVISKSTDRVLHRIAFEG